MVNKLIYSFVAAATLFSSACTFAYEPYVSIGANYHSGNYDTQIAAIDEEQASGSGYHLGVGILTQFGDSHKHWLGAGIDLDEMLGNTITGYRAIDYRYEIWPSLRSGVFIGAASLDSGLPQNGYYYGFTANWLEAIAKADIGFEVRFASGLARDRIYKDDPTPPAGSRPDIFVNILSSTVNLTWRF